MAFLGTSPTGCVPPEAALSVGLRCPVGHHQSQCELLVMAECEGQLGGKCTMGCEPEGLRDENWE